MIQLACEAEHLAEPQSSDASAVCFSHAERVTQVNEELSTLVWWEDYDDWEWTR